MYTRPSRREDNGETDHRRSLSADSILSNPTASSSRFRDGSYLSNFLLSPILSSFSIIAEKLVTDTPESVTGSLARSRSQYSQDPRLHRSRSVIGRPKTTIPPGGTRIRAGERSIRDKHRSASASRERSRQLQRDLHHESFAPPVKPTKRRDYGSPHTTHAVARSERQETRAGRSHGQEIVRIPALKKVPEELRPVPWYYEWPEIVEFYRFNPPDYTGSKLYQVAITSSTKYLSGVMPDTMTAQIYFTESVKILGRLDDFKILWLKRQTIKLFNRRLSDRKKALNTESISIVTHFVADAFVADDEASMRAHLRGLLGMVKAIGGLEALDSLVAKVVILWMISLCRAHCPENFIQSLYPAGDRPTGAQDRISYDGTLGLRQNVALNCTRNPAARYSLHPLRVASQPLHSGLSKSQRRHHLVISIGSPLHIILFLQTALDDTLAQLRDFNISPDRAIAAIQGIYDNLANAVSSMPLPVPPFARDDAEMHSAIIECARTCTRMLAAQALHRLISTPVTVQTVQDAKRAFWAMQITPSMVGKRRKMVTWALFVVIPFSTVDLERQNALQWLSSLCKSLHFTEWNKVKAFLRTYFFCEWLQEEPCFLLWQEIQQRSPGWRSRGKFSAGNKLS